MNVRQRLVTSAVIAILLACASPSSADETAPAPTGAPPPEAKAVVEAPKEPGAEPKMEKGLDGTTATGAAGGLLTTGNSRLLALTANGAFDTRFDDNGIGASLLGNYGEGAPGGKAVHVTTENIQGRGRYDRYLSDRLAVFLLNTLRHDRFQGLDLRYNLDPGVKLLFTKEALNALWGELGYDLQHDIRRNPDRVVRDDSGAPVLDANGNRTILDKTRTDHSSRLFVGFKHGFNKEVTLSTGAEYLQSFVDVTRYRLNFDALFAAKVGGGLAAGFGFSARYDHDPLPGKKTLDTSTTVSLIYAFSDAPDVPKAKTCPCPEEIAPPPPPPPPAPPPPPPIPSSEPAPAEPAPSTSTP